MTASQKGLLLVESDPDVALDILTSIKLIQVPVTVVATVAKALTEIGANSPLMVLSRVAVDEDSAAALKLAQALLTIEQAPPLVVLCRNAERGRIEKYLELFAGELPLPVEFPMFTQQLQQLLQELVWSKEPETTGGR